MGRLAYETSRACPQFAALICGTLALSAFAPVAAAAADICNAIALTDVPDWGDGYPRDASGSVLKKDEVDEAVTQYRINKTTGDAVFCSHGGYCYPRYLTVNGRKIEALRLINCKIGAREPDIPGVLDEDEFYDVVVDRPRNSAAALKYDDLDNTLLRLGMCSACAGNAADIYLKRPQSRCGATVANALVGDKRAIADLQSNPGYCIESSSGAAAASDKTTASVPPATNGMQPTAATPLAPVTLGKPTNPIEVALAIAGVLYFIPSLIGFVRRKRNAPAIFALNLFLGWTFLGWVGALVWSLLGDAKSA